MNTGYDLFYEHEVRRWGRLLVFFGLALLVIVILNSDDPLSKSLLISIGLAPERQVFDLYAWIPRAWLPDPLFGISIAILLVVLGVLLCFAAPSFPVEGGPPGHKT